MTFLLIKSPADPIKRFGGSVRKATPGKLSLKTGLIKVPAVLIVNTELF
jgi:hypothetical protein